MTKTMIFPEHLSFTDRAYVLAWVKLVQAGREENDEAWDAAYHSLERIEDKRLGYLSHTFRQLRRRAAQRLYSN